MQDSLSYSMELKRWVMGIAVSCRTIYESETQSRVGIKSTRTMCIPWQEHYTRGLYHFFIILVVVP